MNKKEFENKRREFYDNMRKMKDELYAFEKAYCEEVMVRNGYKVGDRIEKDGKVGVVSGVELFAGTPRLVVKKIKKDGTVS